MKHAGRETLNELDAVLEVIRGLPRIVERTPGCFYIGPKAFLHFHEDVLGIFADVKLNGEKFERMRVSTKAERERFLRLACVAFKN
jgi:hypothetical protein